MIFLILRYSKYLLSSIIIIISIDKIFIIIIMISTFLLISTQQTQSQRVLAIRRKKFRPPIDVGSSPIIMNLCQDTKKLHVDSWVDLASTNQTAV